MKNYLGKNHTLKKYIQYVLFSFLLGFNSLSVNAQTVSEIQRRKAECVYYQALRQIHLGNITDGFQMLLHCLQIDPSQSGAKCQLSNFYRVLYNDSVASAVLKEAVQDSPNNYWYKYALVDCYARQDNIDDALSVVEEMLEQYPNKEDVLMMALAMYKQNQDYPNVIKLLNRLEVKEGKNESLSMEKYRTFLQMEDKEKAFNEIQSLVKEYPNEAKYQVLLGDLYLSNDENDKAYKIYSDIQKQDSSNIAVMASLLDYYVKTDKKDEYQNLVKRICVDPQLENETRMKFLSALVVRNLNEREDSTLLFNVFDQVLTMPQNDTQVAELYVKYMLTVKTDSTKVKPVLNKMLSIDPECDMARHQLLVYAIEEQDTTGVIRVCRPAVDYSSDNPLFYYYLGIAYYQKDNPQEAIDVFRKGINVISPSEDPRSTEIIMSEEHIQLLANIYTLMGDCYHKMGDMKRVYEAYDSCLLLKPDETIVLNNYAYYLSLESKQLDKAEKMSKRTIEKEPDNYTYLDTYAWVLFQQKKYSEAKVYIDKTLSVMNNEYSEDDAGIIEHAGDIYAKNGLMQQAIDFWQQSSDLGNKSSILEKKLKKQKYYAY